MTSLSEYSFVADVADSNKNLINSLDNAKYHNKKTGERQAVGKGTARYASRAKCYFASGKITDGKLFKEAAERNFFES